MPSDRDDIRDNIKAVIWPSYLSDAAPRIREIRGLFPRKRLISRPSPKTPDFRSTDTLLATLAEKVIAPAEGKVKALEERRRMIEAELTKPQ
jgi:hypothetical protein